MTPFETSFKRVVLDEGGWSDRKSDPGGKTMWGITEAVAREHGYAGDMKDLSLEQAKEIAKKAYWDVLGGDLIAAVSFEVADKLFNAGYNGGTGTAAVFLQRALNVFNMRGKDYPDLKVDGKIGLGTAAALRAFLDKRGREGELVMLKAINCLQGTRFIELAEKNEALEDFEYGWIRSRITLA